MKNKIDFLIDEAFADELLQLPPERVDNDKISEAVFTRLNLKQPEKPVLKLSKMQPKRLKPRILLIAAILIVLTATGVLAASEILKLSSNEVDYFPDEKSIFPSAIITEQSEPEISHDTTGPLFHEGLKAAIEKLNTPVGKTITSEGVSITLDNIAIDSCFAFLFFTAEYEEAIDFKAMYPDVYPATYPEYSNVMGLIPTFWMGINQDAQPPDAYWPSSYDGYFVDDRTIRFSLCYTLMEEYPDELTIHAKAFHIYDTSGQDLMGQRPETTDANPFTFQVSVDKSEENPYCREAEPGEYTLDTENGQETLSLKRLSISPFGASMTFQVSASEDSHEIEGLYPHMLYMEDDKGNVIDIYEDPTIGSSFPYSQTNVTELIGLSPEAESITFTPIRLGGNKLEKRTYQLEGIVGQKIEISSLGGFIVRSFTIKDSSVEMELEPYGRVNVMQRLNEIYYDDEHVTTANGHTGLLRYQYNHGTNIYTFALDYYAATEEELKSIESFSAYYTDYRLDSTGSLTIPIKPVNDN